MNLETELRDVLAERAEEQDPPRPPLDGLLAGGRRRARARTAGRVATLVVAALVVAGLVAVGPRPDLRAVEPADPVPAGPRLSFVPYCVVGDPAGGAPDVLRIGGRDLPEPCRRVAGERRWWHHAGVTVRLDADRLALLTPDGETPLGEVAGEEQVSISEEGRSVVWRAPDGDLMVDDLTDDRPALQAGWPAAAGDPAGGRTVWGMDMLGRVYVGPGHSDRPWMYDAERGSWQRLRGLPGPIGGLVSVTATGLVVRVPDSSAGPGIAVEGSVTGDGRFLAAGEVAAEPVHWSRDDLRYLQREGDGLTVRRAADPGDRVRLDLPYLPPGSWWDAHWDTADVLAIALGTGAFRCSAVSGNCRELRGVELPLSVRAPLPG